MERYASSMEKNSSKKNVAIPVLSIFSPLLNSLKERFVGLGYDLVDLSQDDLIANWKANESTNPQTPTLGLVPLSGELTLDQIQTRTKSIREECPDLYIVGSYSGKLAYKLNDLYQAGLNGYYQCPLEEELLINKAFELAPLEVDDKELSYDQLLRINIIEIEKMKDLSFNVYLYLPMNQKIILYLEESRPIDERVIKKFRENRHYSMYIRRSDIRKYLDYCRHLLESNSADAELSELERVKEKSKKIAGLMGGFFSDDSMSEEESKAMFENIKSVIEGLEDESGSKRNLLKSVSQFASQQMTHISHAQNVSAYCCLFGMALGIMEPETLRMGGLLHDLGLSDLPSSLIGRNLEEMGEEEAAKYKLHPGGGKYSIEEKKLQVPQAVVDMVLYHHERPDGSGYPYGLKAEDIPPIAKVCAFADEFDKLTSVRTGYRQLSPTEAMLRLSGRDGLPPESVFEPDFHGPLVDLFMLGGISVNQSKDSANLEKNSSLDMDSIANRNKSTPKEIPDEVKKKGTSLRDLMNELKAKSNTDSKIEISMISSEEILNDLRDQLAHHFAEIEAEKANALYN